VRIGEGGPAGFFLQWEKIATLLCSDLFEQTCQDTGCHHFLMGGYLTEMNNLRALVLQLLPPGGKHLEELVFVDQRCEFGGLSPEWQPSSRMGVLHV